jgi:hypothetical protein
MISVMPELTSTQLELFTTWYMAMNHMMNEPYMISIWRMKTHLNSTDTNFLIISFQLLPQCLSYSGPSGIYFQEENR